jgi:hypothetical protein
VLKDTPVTGKGDSGDADLAVFVDRLAAAGSDRPTALARAQIRRAIGEGTSPPGVRRLAEALAASVTDRPPSPRRPTEDSGSVVEAMRENTLVVLEDVDSRSLAGSIGALLADGKRLVVTASDPAQLDAVREALPPDVAGRVLGRLPTLPCEELRELRGLLATSTPSRRARARQHLPAAGELPPTVEVAELCARAVRPTGSVAGAWMVPGLLTDLEPARRAAVTSVARLVDRSLGALPAPSEGEWVWTLLSDLILTRHRAVFDRMLEDTAQAVTAVEAARNAARVTFTTPLDAAAVVTLRNYCNFLSAGGRTRSYFRSALQREVAPVLEQVRVDDHEPASEDEVRRVVENLELGQRLRRIGNACVEMRVPAPRDEAELRSLTAVLVQVAAAVRSVGALRHDVLFLAPNSPLSVPDLETAGHVATSILDFEVHGSAAEAGRTLDTMTDRLGGSCTVDAMAPEHELALAALRARDGAGFAAAVEALGGARREQRDEVRRFELLQRLGGAAPGLADAWTVLADTHPAALGIASFVPMDALLSAVPPPDSADVVLVLGAPALGVERLLLMAVAPRMIAVVAPGERPDGAPTLLSVLHRASALTIRGRTEGVPARVVPISKAVAGRPTRAAAGA